MKIPLPYIQKRALDEHATVLERIVAYLISIVVALAIGAIPILAIGRDPIKAYYILLNSSIGSPFALSETLVKASPIILTGLTVALALKAFVWNIGGEGQLLMGATFATIFALFFPTTPYLLIWVAITAFLSGAGWATLAGLLKTKLDVNIILATLMMNFIATNFLSLMVTNYIQEAGFYQSPQIPFVAWLPRFFTGTRLHWGIVISILSAVFVWLLLEKRPLGYRIRAVGNNPLASKAYGINITTITLLVMFVGGGLSGLAGFGEVAAIQHKLIPGISPNFGFTGVLVAFLAKYHPLGIIASSFLFAALLNGGQSMEDAGVSRTFTDFFSGLIIFTILFFEAFFQKYRLSIKWIEIGVTRNG